MNLQLCAGCRGEYPATSLDGGRCHACIVRSRDITIPPAFLRDEPAERFAARIAALADRLERIEKEYGRQLNADGKKLLRRAVFATRLDRQRRVWVDGDES